MMVGTRSLKDLSVYDKRLHQSLEVFAWLRKKCVKSYEDNKRIFSQSFFLFLLFNEAFQSQLNADSTRTKYIKKI